MENNLQKGNTLLDLLAYLGYSIGGIILRRIQDQSENNSVFNFFR